MRDFLYEKIGSLKKPKTNVTHLGLAQRWLLSWLGTRRQISSGCETPSFPFQAPAPFSAADRVRWIAFLLGLDLDSTQLLGLDRDSGSSSREAEDQHFYFPDFQEFRS